MRPYVLYWLRFRIAGEMKEIMKLEL